MMEVQKDWKNHADYKSKCENKTIIIQLYFVVVLYMYMQKNIQRKIRLFPF